MKNKNLNFNSIKVRLKLGVIRDVLAIVQDFNSIKVRLKHTLYQRQTDWTEFQFHKGTIKTKYSDLCYATLPEFQFHKGTIKTPSFEVLKLYFAISIP